jgi:DNA topoisomerase-1
MEADLDKIASGDEAWVGVVREFYEPFSAEVERAKVEMPETKAEPEYIGRACPDCEDGQLLIKWGRYGKFIGCSNFPDCRHTEPWLEKIGVKCPLDGGELVERRTRKGRIFYGCANYPECEFTSWKKPLPTPCPNCSGTLVIANKNFAQCLDCETQYPLETVQPEEVPEENLQETA